MLNSHFTVFRVVVRDFPSFLAFFSLHFFFCLFKVIFFIFIFILLFRAVPVAYGGSQARALIRATAAGLHHSHSNAGSEPCVQPIP